MAAEDFFSRWSRPRERAEEAEVPLDAEPLPPAELPPPSLEEVQRLTTDSDYARFVAAGVDEDVKRAALKKLFSDPRFNVMDGLDVYIDDYSVSEPIPQAMLRQLNHARALLDPLAQFEKPLMKLREQVERAVALDDSEPVAPEPPAIDNSDPAAAVQDPADAPADIPIQVSK
ncbi:MAG: DUF3306 domain-containing protein [Burkholderiaceae bacterium]